MVRDTYKLCEFLDAWLKYWDHAIVERHGGRCQLSEEVILVICNNYPNHYFQLNHLIDKISQEVINEIKL